MRFKTIVFGVVLAGLAVAGMWLPAFLGGGRAGPETVAAAGLPVTDLNPSVSGLPAASAVITVAIIAPISGPLAPFGGPARDGALLAIEQANAGGGLLGKVLVPVVLDGGCFNPTTATNAAIQAIDQYHAHYIIGEVCSGASTVIAGIADARQVLQIVIGASSPGVTLDPQGHTRPYVFRSCLTDAIEGAAAARFARNGLGKSNAYILIKSDSYYPPMAQAFGDQFGAIGAVVGRGYFTDATTDFTPFFNAATAAQAGVIYLPSNAGIANTVLGQAKSAGLGLPFVGSVEWDDPTLNLGLASGSYFTDYASFDDPRPVVVNFKTAFTARFAPEIPTAMAALGYDSGRLLIASITAAGVDDAGAARDRLVQLKYDAVTGFIAGFDAQHNPIKGVPVMAIGGQGFSYAATVPPIYPHLALPMVQR